jgi:hypothetical protein
LSRNAPAMAKLSLQTRPVAKREIVFYYLLISVLTHF